MDASVSRCWCVSHSLRPKSIQRRVSVRPSPRPNGRTPLAEKEAHYLVKSACPGMEQACQSAPKVDGDRRRRVHPWTYQFRCSERALRGIIVRSHGRGQRGVPTGQTKTAATHSARAACWPCTEAQKTGMTQKSQQEGAIRRGVMVTDHGQEEWRCISPKRVEKCSCRRSHSDLARSEGASELFLPTTARDSRSTFKYSHTSLPLLQLSLSL